MSGFPDEFPNPEGGELPLWPCCQGCPRQRECPFVYDLRIRRAASQSRQVSCRLTEQASRYRERICCSGSLCCLLDASAELEQALSQALQEELAMIGSLCPQTEIPCL